MRIDGSIILNAIIEIDVIEESIVVTGQINGGRLTKNNILIVY